jgi:acetyl esterase/lipase
VNAPDFYIRHPTFSIQAEFFSSLAALLTQAGGFEPSRPSFRLRVPVQFRAGEPILRAAHLSAAVAVVVALAAPRTAAQDDPFKPQTTPRTIVLWPDGAPGAAGSDEADVPTLTVYLPAPSQATGAGIVVCPGGGYSRLAVDHEGHQVARLLTSRGLAAFILKYRLGPRYHHPAMQQDVLQAIRYVRWNAAEFGLRKDRIGVMGFSAGGHLASTAATLFDAGHPSAPTPIDAVSSRPDFAVLVYPVIAMGEPITHKGSQANLLGDHPSPDLVAKLSTEKQVTPQTPPTFLFHTNEDTGVPPENSVQFYLALRKAGVPAELHVFQKGQHGVGLAPGDPALRVWPELLFTWLEGLGLFRKE